jgi:hypothetical protein
MVDLVQKLVVEGRDDQHVIWALCKQHNVAESFSVETTISGGVEAILASIRQQLMRPRLRTLGVVLDADDSLEQRWQAIADRLVNEGYTSVPGVPDRSGTIIEEFDKPKVGIWLMPDNQLPGMLEDFIAHLIPQDDALRPKAERILADIENQDLHRYALVHHQKALIHTWLAWQRNPGQPMGQAITAQTLNHNESLARSFVDWLNALFG